MRTSNTTPRRESAPHKIKKKTSKAANGQTNGQAKGKTALPATDGAHELIEVRKSSIQGRGVFALQPIAKGDRIVEYKGERITHEEASARYDDENVKRHHTFLFTVDDQIVVDGKVGGNDARYINHSCNPNCEAIVEKGRIWVYARRDIQPGDELLYDYWYSTDESFTEDDLKRIYPCRCGAKRCRGTLAAPPKKAKRLRG
jgi:uncharacterized protein